MPDQTSLTGDMARVAADLLDELALVGAAPHGAHVFAGHVSLSFLDAGDRRIAADALGLGAPLWRHDGSSRVVHTGVAAHDSGELDVEVTSTPDPEDYRRLAEDNETAARAKAATA